MLDELKGQHLSPAIAGVAQQWRGCSLLTMTSAAGPLDAAVVMIRDGTVEVHEVLQARNVHEPVS